MRIFVRVLAALAFAAGCLTAYGMLAPAHATHTLLQLDRQMAGLKRKETTLADGLKFVYLEGGTGEPLVLLHGFGVDKDSFTRVAGHLTSRYRVILPDLIGFGESSRPTDARYDIPTQSERLHRFLQALHVPSAHLGGSSMGGHLALMYALDHPNAVQSLWLLDTAGVRSGPLSEVDKQLAQGKNPLLPRSEQEFAKLFDFAMQQKPFIPGFALRALAEERIARLAFEQQVFPQIWRVDSVEDRVKDLDVPALIVWGQEDRALHPGDGEVLHRQMPRSEFIVMPGIGHASMIEAHAQCAKDYLRFREHPPRAPQASSDAAHRPRGR